MAGRIQSFEATTGIAPTVSKFVRLFTTGTNDGRVIRATAGDDALVVGLSLATVSTTGYAVPVKTEPGSKMLVTVATTVAAGAKLRVAAGGGLRAAGTTTGNKYVAKCIKARTNTGLAWVIFTPNEEV